MNESQLEKFESIVADYFGSPRAVAVDCCTHAIELCLRHKKVFSATCPTHTYISVPFTLEKLKINWRFESKKWQEYYFLGNTNIIDAAVLWREDSYIPGTLMCLSFQFKKHLNLGRGGMILVDDEEDYQALKKMRYDGRVDNIPWAEQNIDTIGYHYYMTPETAALGIEKFNLVKNLQPKKWSWENYPDLSEMKVFHDIKQK